MPLRLSFLAVLLSSAALFIAPATRAGDAAPERWTVGGRTYERVRVVEVSAESVMIAHAAGLTQLDLAALPAELQQRFGFDAAASAAATREAERQLAATAELHRLAFEAKKRQVEQEAAAAERKRASGGILDFAEVEIRPEVDLRPVFTRHKLYLKDQGRAPACAIFALVCALEYEYARYREGHGEQAANESESLSEHYLMWAVQRSHPGTPVNDGYHFTEILNALTEYGVARRALVPRDFNPYLPEGSPSPQALDDAHTRRGFNFTYYRQDDPRLLERIVDALNRQTPVVIGIGWPNWKSIEKQTVLREQKPMDQAAHAVTLIGYRSKGSIETTEFLFRNSFGAQWGIAGCGWIAHSYLKENLLLAFSIGLPTKT